MDPSFNPIFITSKEASSLTGYVSDYITRQCRAGKIKSKQEGRVWVIDKESLLHYFAEEEKRKEANAQALARSREEEYREAQKARKTVEPVPSPHIPAPVPFEWKEEEYRAPIRGSFAALAMTLVVLSAGMYLSLKETQTSVLSMVQTIGEETVTFVGSGVYQTLGIKNGEHRVLAGARYALPDVTLKESRVEKVFARIEKTLLGSKEVPKVALRKSGSLEKNFEVPHLLPPVIEDGGVMLGASLRQVSDSVLGIYMDGVDWWVHVTPKIPPRIISFVGNVGYTLASLSNSAPTRVATSVGGFENFALGVVGHVALAYDTTKETLVTAYHYAPGAKLAAVREATGQESVVASEKEKEEEYFAKESEVKFETVVREGLARLSSARGEVVASAGASGGLSFFESLARGTYEAINGLFGGIGRSVASVFVREQTTTTEEEIREEVVVTEAPDPSEDKESVILSPETSSGSTTTINQYYAVTTTGVSKEYVEERIRLHLDNLDDRVGERIDSVDTGGGGGGSGSVTSLDVSGGTTGFSFAGGPITSSGTLTMSGTLAVANGGTGITAAPTYGQLLLGNSLGGYTLVATSSLGISGGSGTPGGADGEVQFNQGGIFGAESAFSYASTTNTLLVTSGVIQSTSGIFRGDDQYHQIILHNGGNNSDYIEWGDTLAAGGGHRFYTGGATPTLRMQIADDGTYLEGPLGIGTTSPGTRLSVQGNQYTSGSAFFGGALTATSTVALTNYTNGALAVNGSGALYAFSTSSWSFASSTLLSDTNIWSGVNNFISRLSSGSSSPFAKFSIHANNGENYTNNTLFAIGSSTASATTTLFSVSNLGALRLGSGITYTNADNQNIFTISGGSSGTITINPNSGAQLYYSGFGTRLRSTGGYLWDNNSSVGNGTVDLGLMRIAAGTVGVSTGAAGNFTGNLVAERIGLGTSTPYAQFAIVATSTSGIGAPTTLFAIASTTGGTATSTLFSVLNNGNVGIGTTTPGFSMAVEGAAYLGTTTYAGGGVARISIQPSLASSGNVQGAIYLGNTVNTGFTATGGNDLNFVRQNLSAALLTSSGLQVHSDGRFGFSNAAVSGLNFSGSVDAALSRLGTGKLAIGSGLAGNFTGTLVAESIGLGTSTPYAQLAIVATSTNGVGAPTTLFAIASSTAGTATSTLFRVTNTGAVGINAASGAGLTITSSINDTTRLSITPESTNRIAIDAGSGIDMRFAGRIFDFEYATDLNNGFGAAFGFGQSSNAWEMTGSSINQSIVSIGGEFLQTGTASADGLLVAPVFTSLGDGSVGGTGNNIFRAANGTDTKFVINTNGLVGVGTTSPFAKLSVHANNGDTGSTLFAIASSTASATTTFLTVGNTGQFDFYPSSLGASGAGIRMTSAGGEPTLNFLFAGGSRSSITGATGSGFDIRVTAGSSGSATLNASSVAAGMYSNGNFSVATSSPYSKFSVWGSGTGTGQLFGLVNNASTTVMQVLDNGNVGIGSTTPWGRLSVNPNGITGPAFVVGSSTATNFIVTNGGNVGIGTTSPAYTLAIRGTLWADNYDNSQYSVFGAPIVNTSLTAPTAGTDNLVAGIIGTTTASVRAGAFAAIYNSAASANSVQGLSAQAALGANATGNLSLATSGGGIRNRFATNNLSTGYNVAQMSVVSAFVQTAGTLASTTDAAAFHAESPSISTGNLITNMYGLWVRGGAVSGTLTNRYGVYIDDLVGGTNRYGVYQAGTADTNYFAGNVGIGTTSPWTTFSVVGTVAAPGLVNDSTGYYVCMNTTTGQLATSTTACGASSERFKENIEDITYGLDAVMALKPVSFDYKEQYLKNAPHQLGFIAEEVDLVIPELVARNAEGTIQGLDYPKFTSVLVKAIQDVVNIQGTFRNALVAWFASSTNEIGDFVANRIRTTELCVKDASGETCITREVLDELLAGVGATGSEGSSEEPPAEEGGGAGEEPPAEEPPAEEVPPAEEPPVEELPAEDPPVEQPPAEEPPAEEVVTETTI